MAFDRLSLVGAVHEDCNALGAGFPEVAGLGWGPHGVRPLDEALQFRGAPFLLAISTITRPQASAS